MSNWLLNAVASADAAHAAVEETGEVLVRPDQDSDRWHIADPVSGFPVFGEFANSYRRFDSKEEAVEFVRSRGFRPVFD